MNAEHIGFCSRSDFNDNLKAMLANFFQHGYIVVDIKYQAILDNVDNTYAYSALILYKTNENIK